MKGSQIWSLGPPGVAKLYEDEEGNPVVQIFGGGEDGGTPAVLTLWSEEALDGLIKLGQALRTYHQVRMPGRVEDSSTPEGLTIHPV